MVAVVVVAAAALVAVGAVVVRVVAVSVYSAVAVGVVVDAVALAVAEVCDGVFEDQAAESGRPVRLGLPRSFPPAQHAAHRAVDMGANNIPINPRHKKPLKNAQVEQSTGKSNGYTNIHINGKSAALQVERARSQRAAGEQPAQVHKRNDTCYDTATYSVLKNEPLCSPPYSAPSPASKTESSRSSSESLKDQSLSRKPAKIKRQKMPKEHY